MFLEASTSPQSPPCQEGDKDTTKEYTPIATVTTLRYMILEIP